MNTSSRRAKVGAIAAVVVLAGGIGAALLDDDDDAEPGTVPGTEDLPFDVGPGEGAAFDRAFFPATIEAAPGEPVTLRNEDDEPHTFTADEGLFDSGVLAPGATFEGTFEGPQRITFHCDIHPTMTGVLVIE
jgi:plastocyanin